ncbi:GDSL esterase/lipase At1g71691-like [Gastrolobium bilobum]|uniref:GDSL esterase/lipase At1g71691-like n=1 Tax=Gastrolobium bilobum TaxID=150636 RepID=UPI002AB09DB0|nr:GDSL esterase/lipase At1g71691-like [Gastrolobium bilobum]XP_061344685.1 GDSL esterase/lipase At1g71691-like [Gastrolobium bilobum]
MATQKEIAIMKFLCVITVLTHQVLLGNADSTHRLVPALYVFGDSTVDAGNNNNLKTPAKANMYPYGIDFPKGPTGRFTNGKTSADILAIKLGLPMPPPYLGISETERYQVVTGINYASASCGILNSTRAGGCLSLDKQVDYFTSTAKNDLPRNLKGEIELKRHLSNSIYLLSIGSNDYALNYLKSAMAPNAKITPQQFADYLLGQLASRVKRIYDLGARKFVILGIGPLGCIPDIMRNTHSKGCNEAINQMIKPFPDKLSSKLKELQTQLSGSSFISFDGFKFFQQIRNNTEKFGITNISDPCVELGRKPCENRKQYYFFDVAHMSEAANELYAKEFFDGTLFPMNVKQLIAAN